MGLPDPPELGTSALPAGTFQDQVVIVTGGGTGLGKAMAVEFARLGAKLAVLSRNEEHRAAGVAAILAVGTEAEGIACDIRQPEQIAEAFDAVESQLGPPSVLVNNAAGNFPVPAEDMSPNAWRTVVDIVLNGTFYCSREFGRRHIAAGTPGNIVNIGAAYAWTGGPGFAHSAAGKAGVKNMTETLAVEWGPYGIRVNALSAGPIKTLSSSAVGDFDLMLDLYQKLSPLRRNVEAGEVGKTGMFLLSDLASGITGETLHVDSGYHIMGAPPPDARDDGESE